MSAPARQRGVSLVSLLIGTALGLFLIGATLRLYVHTRDRFALQGVIADVAETQQFALDDLRRRLVMAGRGIRQTEENRTDRRSFPPLRRRTAGRGLFDGGRGRPDVVAVRYRRGPACTGYLDIAFPARPATVRFLVNGKDELVCQQNGQRRVVAPNVPYLKALYGVDDDGDGYPNRYLTARQVNRLAAPPGFNSPWVKVVSLRVGLVARSSDPLPRSARPDQAAPLDVLGEAWTPPDTEYLYRAASTTVLLRNLNAGVYRQ